MKKNQILLPPALKKNDIIGLITPASPLFEGQRTLISVEEKMTALGFRTKRGKNIFKRNGYLAGTVEERLQDIHEMFADSEVKAIMAIRGGYGSGHLLPHLDYDLITKHPKIIVGYSDITSLLLGIHRMTGLVTFHGPVAISTFTDFTKKYFLRILMNPEPVGPVEDAPYEQNLQTSNRVWTVKPGVARGPLTGGNLTLVAATLGTPYEIETKDSVLFLEEIGEEPYDLDRLLNHMRQAGKFENCRGVFFDRLKDIEPSPYRPAFNNSLSVEEVIEEVFKEYDFPVCVGLSIGHIKEKPTLPLGIETELNAGTGRISILEAAVS
jgi:muramoyltetrapeptide carboxypeptidase